MGDEEDEDESDAIVNQVLDELGLQLNDKLGDAPVGTGTLAATAAAKNKTAVDCIQTATTHPECRTNTKNEL